MKKFVKAGQGTSVDLLNALEQKIDMLEDNVVTSTQVKGSTDEFENRVVDSMIDRLADDIVDVDTDKMLEVLYSINPDMNDVYEIPYSQWKNVVDQCKEEKYDGPEAAEYKYEIQDTHGLPQTGMYDSYKFEEWYELEEFLDNNPDVRENLDDGYATIIELD